LPPDAAIRRIVGLSLVEAMRALAPALGDEKHQRLARDYKQAFHAFRTSGTLDPEPLFDGIVEALDTLLDTGWVLGVATGKSDRGLAAVLGHHAIADRFVTLQTADRHPSKPDAAMLRAAMADAGANPHMTAMIGDTSFDMAMAKAAGARAIGVAWGYHAPGELIDAGAVLVAERACDLPGLLA
jgi:phosphoglycolate phosphatase